MNTPLANAAPGRDAGRNPRFDARFEELFEGVDDLIKRVADTENPEIRRIRAKVHASMMVAKGACNGRAHAVARPAGPLNATGAGADRISEAGPDEALGVALLVGWGLGVIMSMQP